MGQVETFEDAPGELPQGEQPTVRAVSPCSDADDYEVIGDCDLMSVTSTEVDYGRDEDVDEERCVTPTPSETPVIQGEAVMVESFCTKSSPSGPSRAAESLASESPVLVDNEQISSPSRATESVISEAPIMLDVDNDHVNGEGAPDVEKMKNEIERLQVQLAAKHALEEECEQYREEARKYRRALDETVVRLMTTEDELARYQQLNNNGYESVSMPETQYQAILDEKTREISRLNEENKKLKKTADGEREKAAALIKEMDEMNGLMIIVNDQRREDNAYITEVRRIHEQRIKLLQDEITSLKTGHKNNSPDMVFLCPQCSVRFTDIGMFNRHLVVCAAELPKPSETVPVLRNLETGEPSSLLL